jgi:hypothetical protein
MTGDEAAQADPQHRAGHAAGHEGPGQRRAHPGGEDAQHHGDADAAVGRLAEADQEAGEHHLVVGLGDGAAEGGQAPQHRHDEQAAHPAEPLRQQRERKGQQADHQGDDPAQRTELDVRQPPLRLQEREDGAQNLT